MVKQQNQLNNDTYLFLLGLKPGLLTSINGTDYKILRKYQYPFVFHNQQNILFLQSKEKKMEYLQQENGLPKDNPFGYNDANMGKSLGYPPNAVEVFNKSTLYNRVLIDYHGITFATDREHFVEDMKWMKSNYQVPVLLQKGIEIEILNGGGKSRKETSIYFSYNDSEEMDFVGMQTVLNTTVISHN